ncbi:twin-arginine translocation signal domain-containing protein [uncultured Piscinibacter sp.]|uniref:twin-arginine translocation signal domain-containing protein n=1 Tax=uncultured Piscinibacter sp. TaxID=1131835 RepID=UPI00261E7FF9|nr:twin-arginine translocation signal domain-containing protein [uncultured Piscinibacter sp.]
MFAESGCEDESSGQVPKLDLPLARRDFLKGSGVLMGTLATGSVLAALAPSTVWAVELKSLSKSEGEALMKMGRTLYPHKKLPDAVYALLAKDLDAKAAGDAGAAKLLREGIAALNQAAGGSFAKASEKKRKEIVKGMEGQPFFATVRGQCITSLYDNDMAYKVFGYPGSAWEKGGYITRGFQDLKWLPAPPLEASPKPYL